MKLTLSFFDRKLKTLVIIPPPRPRPKKQADRRGIPPRTPPAAPSEPTPSGATAQPVASPFRIRGEKSPNINQKRQQFRRKLKIARKRRNTSQVRRAGRNSPLKPPFRPARFLVGVFGDLGYQGEGCAWRKNEGAVADQRLLTALTAFFSSQRQSQWLKAAHFRSHNCQWRALGSDPYGRFAPSRSCLWSERHGRRLPIPVVAGRGQKSVRRSGSRPLLGGIPTALDKSPCILYNSNAYRNCRLPSIKLLGKLHELEEICSQKRKDPRQP